MRSSPSWKRAGERGTTVVYADRFVSHDERGRAIETGD
jgi:antirestriction protein ArdC